MRSQTLVSFFAALVFLQLILTFAASPLSRHAVFSHGAVLLPG